MAVLPRRSIDVLLRLWGRVLIYTVTDLTVELKSYGADGEPGGEDDDRDLIGTFSLKDSNGKWSAERGWWISDDFRKID